MTCSSEGRGSLGVGTFLIAVSLTICFLLSASLPAVAQEKWKQLFPEYVPIGRDDHMMAFDSDRGVVVLFGGDNAGSATWVWDGVDWKDLGIPSPAPRRESAMAYDARRKVVVMFGGHDYVIDNQSTWEFNGTEWRQVVPEESPDGRSDHAMVYDSHRRVIVMFGGERVDNSTWAYNGHSWFSVNPEDNGPTARWGHTMAYDSKRKKIVLFGGYSGELLGDTWEWDGSRWEEVFPDNSPPAMREHVMVYDSLRERVVLFGGRDDTPDGFDRTWEWDGSNWVEVDTPVKPPARHECAAAYDSWRNRMVVFGGSSGNEPDNRFMDDTWWYPNNPPVILHEPVLGAFPDRDLRVEAEIVDYDEDRPVANLFYRAPGDDSFLRAQMERDSGDTFFGLIPAEGVHDKRLEYYIRVSDPEGSGRSTFSGSPEKPYVVTISDFGSLTVKIAPKNARVKGARWRIKGEKKWLKSGAVVKKLNPGELTIEFKTIQKWEKPEPVTLTIINGRRTVHRTEYARRQE